MQKTYVARYTGDFGGAVPTGITPAINDIATDTTTGLSWQWTGARWVQFSWITGTRFSVGSGGTVEDQLATSLPGSTTLYAGDAAEVPVELRRSAADLVIQHNLGVAPSSVTAQLYDAESGVLIGVTPSAGNCITSEDGNWTAWRNYNCDVNGAAAIIVISAVLSSIDTGDGFPGSGTSTPLVVNLDNVAQGDVHKWLTAAELTWLQQTAERAAMATVDDVDALVLTKPVYLKQTDPDTGEEVLTELLTSAGPLDPIVITADMLVDNTLVVSAKQVPRMIRNGADHTIQFISADSIYGNTTDGYTATFSTEGISIDLLGYELLF